MKVEVYGGKHSPWVQAVLLALHEKDIEHTLHSIPPLEAFKRWGVYMPAASIDDGPWEIESSQIFVKLGLEPISDEDLRAVQGAWQGVQHRPDNPLRFFAAFARAGDTSPSFFKRSVRNFVRSFVPFYMCLLIHFVKWKLKPADPENFSDQYLVWERVAESSTGPFLDGDAPDTRHAAVRHSSVPFKYPCTAT